MSTPDEPLPAIGAPLTRGEFILLTCAGKTVDAMVTLASPNGRSIVVMFDGHIVDNHVQMMALTQLDDGSFVALMTGTPVKITRATPLTTAQLNKLN